MKIYKILMLTVVSVFIIASNAMAISLYDITSISGTEDYFDTGLESVALTDTDDTLDDVTAFLFLELAGYKDLNTFGIYDFSVDSDEINLGNTLEVFSGAQFPLTSVTLEFDLDAGKVTNKTTGAVANIDETFGFYITTPDDETYYSHTMLNKDGYDHILMFDTRDNSVGGLLGSNVVLAMEDLYGGGDRDYNDMVVGVSDVVPVPEPATMLLLGTGLVGLAGLGRKKYLK